MCAYAEKMLLHNAGFVGIIIRQKATERNRNADTALRGCAREEALRCRPEDEHLSI